MTVFHRKPVIGITLGDPAGIGPEIVAKALRESSLKKLADFVVIGDPLTSKRFVAGRPNRLTAAASLNYLQAAIQLLKEKKISALVTAPVCKEAISKLGVPFQGHTEFLAEAFKVKNYEMLFVGKDLRTIIVTRHIPLMKVAARLSIGKIDRTIELAHRSLRDQFRIQRPHIAVCGLNPHAGEHGLIGKEEIDIIIPAIQKARRKKICVEGPFPADTLFSPRIGKKYDVVIAMYHDQGLIPIKTMEFENLVNLTIGLPFVRTSPAHGTAFDIAGKNKANPASMIAAIRLAAKLSYASS
ncbi:MAG: 4-hydroxythreonine-4-phosphate dehydrogenase PdxA [Candidatus Omnitrophica bacterium]|nr:4-hydroxythreonine-4-phosphate dehydrogenase PdxA [Candidatus Omnitrophota bacterium]